MKTILTEEIIRIYEIMGIKSKLILEGKLFNLVSDSIKEFLEKAEKKATGVADEFIIAGQKMTKRTYDNLIEALENPGLFDALNSVEKKILGKISAQIPEVVDSAYSDFVKSTISKLNAQNVADASERSIVELINADITKNPGKTVYDSLSELIADEQGNYDEFLCAILDRKYRKKIMDLNSGKYVDEVSGYLNISGRGPGLRNTKIKTGSISDMINQFMKGTNAEDLQTVLRVYKRVFKNMYELQTEFIGLCKSIETKLSMVPAEDISYEIKKMGDIMIAGKKWYNEHPEKFFNDLLSTGEVSPSVRDAVLSIGKNNKYKEAFLELQKDANYLEGFKIEWQAFKGLWPFRSGAGTFKEAFKRWGMFILTKDPRFPSDIKKVILSRGIKGELAMNLINRIALVSWVYPALLSGFLTIFQGLIAGLEYFYNILPNSNLNIVDWNESGYTKNDWAKILSERFMKNFEMMSPGTWYEELMNPTLVDEVLGWIKSIIPAGKDLNEDELRKFINQRLNETDEKIKNSDEYKQLSPEQKRFVDDLLGIRTEQSKIYQDNKCLLDNEGNPIITLTQDNNNKANYFAKGKTSTGVQIDTVYKIDNHGRLHYIKKDGSIGGLVCSETTTPQPVQPEPQPVQPQPVQPETPKTESEQFVQYLSSTRPGLTPVGPGPLEGTWVAQDNSSFYFFTYDNGKFIQYNKLSNSK